MRNRVEMYLESIFSFSKTGLLFPSCSSAACSDFIARALKTCEVMDPLDVAVVDIVGGGYSDNNKLGGKDETTIERSDQANVAQLYR
jgi:hypothetical protein